MDIGKEQETYTITPVTQPAKAPAVPEPDWAPAQPAAPVEDPAKTPVKTPSR